MLVDAMLPSVNRQAEVGRLGFYDRARQQNLAPLWRVLNGLVAERPMASTVPAIFKYE